MKNLNYDARVLIYLACGGESCGNIMYLCSYISGAGQPGDFIKCLSCFSLFLSSCTSRWLAVSYLLDYMYPKKKTLELLIIEHTVFIHMLNALLLLYFGLTLLFPCVSFIFLRVMIGVKLLMYSMTLLMSGNLTFQMPLFPLFPEEGDSNLQLLHLRLKQRKN